MAYVYRHIRLDTMTPFYIGIGKDAEGQYKRAQSDKNRNPHWRHIVSKVGYRFDIIIDDVNWAQASEKEIEFIAIYGRTDKKTGFLCNQTDGGEGNSGSVITESTKEKLRNALDKYHAPGREAKALKQKEKLEIKAAKIKDRDDKKETARLHKEAQKLEWAKLGKKQNPESIEKRRLANTGKIRTPEQREKLKGKTGKWMLGKKDSLETIHKKRERMLNMTDEHRAKISAAGLGRKHSPESIAKMRIAQQKGPLSEETKAKLSYVLKNLSPEKRRNQTLGKSFGITAYCVKTNIEIGKFDSINDCARFLKISPSTICRYLQGQTKVPLNYFYVLNKPTDAARYKTI